jgi:hypothetical protein
MCPVRGLNFPNLQSGDIFAYNDEHLPLVGRRLQVSELPS